jgi:hypothetical protein
VVITRHKGGIEMLKKIDGDTLFIECPVCQKEFEQTISADFEFEFNEEFNQYVPAMFSCVNCAVGGKDVNVFINPHIPESEFDEYELEITGLIPQKELNARKFTRDLMWRARPDLKKMSRTTYNENAKQKLNAVQEKFNSEVMQSHLLPPFRDPELSRGLNNGTRK